MLLCWLPLETIYELMKSGKDTQVACNEQWEKEETDQNKSGKELKDTSGQCPIYC